MTTTIPWTTALSRTLICALIWWSLAKGAAFQWWMGIPVIVLAVTASFALLPPSRIVWIRLLWFVPFFLVQSIIGATDVGWRAFHPRLPIAPDLVQYPLRLSSELSQVFMANVVSLMPGTLSAELDGRLLTVHVLVSRPGIFSKLEKLEQRIAHVYGEQLRGG